MGVVEVEDEGPGIPEGNEEHLMEPFTRGDANSADSGFGLGLSTAKAIAADHGGYLRLANSTLSGLLAQFGVPIIGRRWGAKRSSSASLTCAHGVSFVNSKSDILIQAADVLVRSIRRVLEDDQCDPKLVTALGRLQIIRRREGVLQSMQFIVLAGQGNDLTHAEKVRGEGLFVHISVAA